MDAKHRALLGHDPKVQTPPPSIPVGPLSSACLAPS